MTKLDEIKAASKPRFHPSLSDKVVQDALENAEKQIAHYTAVRDAALKELKRREKAKKG